MRKLIRCFFVIIFIINSFVSVKYLLDRHNSGNLSKNLREDYHSGEDNTKVENKIKEKSNKMIGENNDFIGWINIPNTNIDYPVVQADNNSFYLERDFKKNENVGGCIFVDYLDKVADNIIDGDKNLVIFGHHMRNGSMFGDLKKFKEADFFNNNKYISFTTKSKEFKFEVFSVYVEKASNYYRKHVFLNNDEYIDFVTKIKNKSVYGRDIELSKEDNIITLSTCSYEFDDARLVVHAKMVH